jgi:hypothetical protein
VTVYGLLRLLDGVLIVGALDIFAADKVTVGTNLINSNAGIAAPFLRRERYRTLSHRRLAQSR